MLKTFSKLPQTATPPFCPSEIEGVVADSSGKPFWRRLLAFAGPGLLISVGYMDPGNWATDIEAGSKFQYGLLSVVLFSSLSAIVLQCLSMRLGLVSGKDLAVHCREQQKPALNFVLWIFAELAIIATDVAEVLGSALAFQLLFHIPIKLGIFLTALDTLIVLSLKGRGFRQLEAIMLGLVSIIGICFFIELWWLHPDWSLAAQSLLPGPQTLNSPEKLFLAIGILGATVMPHNLYLHSSIIKTRVVKQDVASKKDALKLATYDTVISLSLAFFVNAAILLLAASAFHAFGHQAVTGIDDAYRLLEPVTGGQWASIVFGIALLASGQSSTFTGTLAGQIILEGFLELKLPCWQRRVITRTLALVPAFIGIWLLGEKGVGKLLIISQVVLSMQLPFAIFPLISFNQKKSIMGSFKISRLNGALTWSLFGMITTANCFLIYHFLWT